jgi:hypothetical protein
MFQISTQYEGRQYTVDLHQLVIDNTYCHRLDRETLYKTLVRHKIPGIERHFGHQQLSFVYGVHVQRQLEKTNGNP